VAGLNSDERSELQVEQRVEPGSMPRPIAFNWQGTRWVVNSVGRTWESDEEHHYLLMVQGDRVFELAYADEAGSWRLVREPGDFGPGRGPRMV
jgi:hypothetical protein